MLDELKQKVLSYGLGGHELKKLRAELLEIVEAIDEQLFAEQLQADMNEEMEREAWDGLEEY